MAKIRMKCNILLKVALTLSSMRSNTRSDVQNNINSLMTSIFTMTNKSGVAKFVIISIKRSFAQLDLLALESTLRPPYVISSL